MLSTGTLSRLVFVEADCTRQLCADCTYSTDVPRAYGHNIVQLSRAWHGDQEEHLHLLVNIRICPSGNVPCLLMVSP